MRELCSSRRSPSYGENDLQLLGRTRSFRPGMEVVSVCPPRAFRSAALDSATEVCVSTAVPQICFVDFLAHGERPWLYSELTGGSWQLGLAVFPVRSRNSTEPVEPQATITCCSGTPLCQRQAGLGLAFGPPGEGLLGGILYTPLPPRCAHTVPSVTRRGGDGHSWGVHLLPGKAGGGPGSHLPTGL